MIKCLTPEQNNFLESLLKQLNVSPAAPDAVKVIEMVQAILLKINEA